MTRLRELSLVPCPHLHRVVGHLLRLQVPVVGPANAVEGNAAALRVDAQHRVDPGAVVEVDEPGAIDAIGEASVAGGGIVATGVEPSDAAGDGVVDHRVERARPVARAVVRRAQRSGDDVDAVCHEPVDGSLGLGRRAGGRQEQLGPRCHVLDDLGNGDTVSITLSRVDQPAEAQAGAQAELMGGVGGRSVFGSVPGVEIEEVDDADADVAGDADVVPGGGIDQRCFLPDHRAEATLDRWDPVDPNGQLHEVDGWIARQCVDSAGRYQRLHRVALDSAGDRAAHSIDHPLHDGRVVGQDLDRDQRVALPLGVVGEQSIHVMSKLGVGVGHRADGQR